MASGDSVAVSGTFYWTARSPTPADLGQAAMAPRPSRAHGVSQAVASHCFLTFSLSGKLVTERFLPMVRLGITGGQSVSLQIPGLRREEERTCICSKFLATLRPPRCLRATAPRDRDYPAGEGESGCQVARTLRRSLRPAPVPTGRVPRGHT